MAMSNVIDLEARRRQKAQPEEEPRRGGSILSAAGFVIMVPSAAFLGFVAYQAIRLDMVGDTFVVGLFMALAGYLAVGGALARFGKRLAPVRSLSKQELQNIKAEISASDNVLEFPLTQNPAAGGLISIQCPRCVTRYVARTTDLSCPSCGRAALAG